MNVHIQCITSLLYTFYIGAVIISAVVYFGRQWSLENAIYVVLYPCLLFMLTLHIKGDKEGTYGMAN